MCLLLARQYIDQAFGRRAVSPCLHVDPYAGEVLDAAEPRRGVAFALCGHTDGGEVGPRRVEAVLDGRLGARAGVPVRPAAAPVKVPLDGDQRARPGRDLRPHGQTHGLTHPGTRGHGAVRTRLDRGLDAAARELDSALDDAEDRIGGWLALLLDPADQVTQR